MSNAKAIVKAFTATVGLILVVGIITASAQTSQFVSMMRNARVFFADGTSSLPSVASATTPASGMYFISGSTPAIVNNTSQSAAFYSTGMQLTSTGSILWSSGALNAASDTSLCRGAANVIGIGGCTSSFPALKRNAAQLEVRLADDSAGAPLIAAGITSAGNVSINSTSSILLNGVVLIARTAPTISSGFGTSPSIVNSNGPSAFTLNVGTGGAATSGVVGLPTATTGWSCFANDRTNNTVTRQTATTTTSATFTAAAAWAASDILNISCFGY
jgi:hypothetical protein